MGAQLFCFIINLSAIDKTKILFVERMSHIGATKSIFVYTNSDIVFKRTKIVHTISDIAFETNEFGVNNFRYDFRNERISGVSTKEKEPEQCSSS